MSKLHAMSKNISNLSLELSPGIRVFPYWRGLVLIFLGIWIFAQNPAAADDFYNRPRLFSTRPSPTKSSQTIARFGPVGIGIDLVQPAFRMKVHNIEEGSPAAATGKFKQGQIIESINGRKLKDIDPRIQLGRIITQAEASDGRIVFRVRDKDDAPVQEVTVQIPVLGVYSDTWPLNCPKSARIVRNFADYLAEQGWGDGHCGLNGPALLFLLSTGEDKDLATARRWIRKTIDFYAKNPAPFKNWRIGYGGVPLAEYYLRTGDRSILPVIQKYADLARDHHYLGGWAHGGTGLFPYMNGGHMNAAGSHVLAFLLLAKECGVEVDEQTLQSSLRQFYRFAGRGLNPYGDQRPEAGFVDNGKCGRLAFAMSAAASLKPDGWDSLYAQASYACALKSFYTTPWMNHGHTGGGIGEVWRSFAMGLLYAKRPTQYRSFMGTRQWFYELSRRYDGSFGIPGGGRYDGRAGTTPVWGHAMALTYTAPRKTLQITGAPDTEYSHKYELPERPWGTAADDRFLSLKPVAADTGNTPSVEEETLKDNSAMRMLERLRDPNITKEQVRFYAHHQDHAIRRSAAQRAAGMVPIYMGTKKPTKALYPDLVTEFLKSNDPRLRWAGAYAVTQLPDELLTEGNFSLLMKMVENPRESWWVMDRALQAVSTGDAELIAPHLDRLVQLLEHREWWLQNSALSALMPLMADEHYTKKIFPALSRLIATNQRYSTLGPLRNLSGRLAAAPRSVQKAAVEMLGEAYLEFSPENQTREVPNAGGAEWHLKLIARYLADCPGGLEKLLEVGRRRFPKEILPHRECFLGRSDLASLSPKVRKALQPIVLNEMVPMHVGANYNQMVRLAANEVQSGFPGGRNDPLDQLADLYRKAGIEGFEWHMFADLRKKEWWYHTFDPIPEEQVPWDQLITRYRNVTLPDGMQNWYAMDFAPQKLGWKRGRGAFGQYNGEIPEFTGRCTGPPPHCFCGTKVNTLWDKEILLFRGTFQIPPLKKDGYRYRLRVNTGDHVGAGGGYEVYVNGKGMTARGRCPRRGEGGLPKGAFVTKKWMKEFEKDKVTIAVKSFLRFNRKYKHKPTNRIPQGKISVHIEEMKIPPFAHDMVVKSAELVPMKTAEWQAKQFSNTSSENPEPVDEVARRQGTAPDGKFQYDGEFKPNPAIMGSWTFIGQVQDCNEFSPGKDIPKTIGRSRRPLRELTLKAGGRTDSPTRLWSGNILMNLSRYEALRMIHKKIDGDDYLFVEAGGFHRAAGIPVGWKSPWCVMGKK